MDRQHSMPPGDILQAVPWTSRSYRRLKPALREPAKSAGFTSAKSVHYARLQRVADGAPSPQRTLTDAHVDLTRRANARQSCEGVPRPLPASGRISQRQTAEGACLDEDTGLAAGRSSQKPATTHDYNLKETYASVARMPTTEHILLESDFRHVPDVRAARRVHARIEFRSRLRRRVLQLEIIDYYYLSVRSYSGAILLEYVLDLRFVDAPRRLRHIAWRWITFSLLLIALALGIASRIGSSATPWWQHDWLPVCVTVTVVWAFATLVGVYRTTEIVSLFSTYGAARLLECTGGLGTFRVFRGFMAKLAAHILLASAARRRTKAEHLRDEMREHLRLKENGVLTAGEYETAKVRILRQHSPAVQPPLARASTRL